MKTYRDYLMEALKNKTIEIKEVYKTAKRKYTNRGTYTNSKNPGKVSRKRL
jgi:hypothetical protein